MSANPSEVIDLCSDEDDEQQQTQAHPSSNKRIRLEKRDSSSSSSDDSVILVSSPSSSSRSEALSNNAAKLRKAAGSLKSDDSSTSTKETAEANIEPFVFLSNHGADNCIVTGGLMKLLVEIPNVLSCAVPAERKRTAATAEPTQCRPSTLHHIQQHDKWSCGFRNFQMLLTAIAPKLPDHHAYHVFAAANSSAYDRKLCIEIPSLQLLQQHMEASWREGFDRKGAEHYRGRIVGKKAWIGAVEALNLLSFMGIDSTVVQFIKCRESRQLLAPFCTAYFAQREGNCRQGLASQPVQSSKAKAYDLLQRATGTRVAIEPPCSCSCLPLYLQWEGHSVTVVGVEQPNQNNDSARYLLVFDPLKSGTVLTHALEQHNTKPLRLDCQWLEKRDCQIILSCTRAMSEQERESRKHNSGTITAAEAAVLRVRSY